MVWMKNSVDPDQLAFIGLKWVKYVNLTSVMAQMFIYLKVKYRCDVDLWTPGPSNCRQSLLHRAIDENNEAVACFLIKR